MQHRDDTGGSVFNVVHVLCVFDVGVVSLTLLPAKIYFQPAGQPTSKNSALVTDFETTSGIVSKTLFNPIYEQTFI